MIDTGETEMTDAPKILAPVMPEMFSAWSTTRGQYDWNQWDYIREDLAKEAEHSAYLRGLEDAAKVADGMADGRYRTWRFMQGGNRAEGSDEVWIADQIAAAIRALAKGGGE